MADIQLLLEAERRGLLPPDKKALLDEARRRGLVAGAAAQEEPEPERTFGGYTKEAFKGIIPGVAGLAETAITGAAALLPEEQEQAVRGAVAGVTEPIREYFAPAPGYEDTFVRKVSEGVGSTLPFLPLGLAGALGRVAATGLAVSVGAGEARQRAEEAGATDEQRATATALGIAPGALEALPPIRILRRFGFGDDAVREVAGTIPALKRIARAGGEEALQEASSEVLQNLIAKGVYAPDEAVFGGVGEAAAVGGGAGAVVSAIAELALGRRARGPEGEAPEEPPAAPVEPEAPPAPQLNPEAVQTAQDYMTRVDAGEEKFNWMKGRKMLREMGVDIPSEAKAADVRNLLNQSLQREAPVPVTGVDIESILTGEFVPEVQRGVPRPVEEVVTEPSGGGIAVPPSGRAATGSEATELDLTGVGVPETPAVPPVSGEGRVEPALIPEAAAAAPVEPETIEFDDGSKYVGAVDPKTGLFQGAGVYTDKTGGVFEGNFVKSKLQGIGTYTMPTGDVYEGEFKNDKYNGTGTYAYADGSYYKGTFKNDKFNGEGEFVDADGTIMRGAFKNGKFLGEAILPQDNTPEAADVDTPQTQPITTQVAGPTLREDATDEEIARYVEEKDRLPSTTSVVLQEGDAVRVGNMPGTIIGVEGDYVKFRPVNARREKAYQRVPASMVTFESRPNDDLVSLSKKLTEKFGEEAGVFTADMDALIPVIGANMYKSNIADVAVKEMLQNSFDAVKESVKKGQVDVGDIDVSINRNERTLTVQDNGVGMTPEIIRKAFFTIGGSAKELDPSETSGGLGMAKMGVLMGSERVQIDTVRDGVRTTVDATRDEIAQSNFKIRKSPAPKGEHGTKVTLKIPETYIDTLTGDAKTVWFPYGSSAISIFNKPLVGPAKVIFNDVTREQKEELPIGVNFDTDEMPKLTSADTLWGTLDVYMGRTRKKHPRHDILSSGIWQFQNPFVLSGNEKIPYDIIVNVKPKVRAKDINYPFTNDREHFKDRVEDDINSLQSYMQRIARGEEAKDLQQSFKDLVQMPRVEAGEDLKETSKKLQKVFDKRRDDEPKKFVAPKTEEKIVITDEGVKDSVGNVIVEPSKPSDTRRERSFKADKAPPSMEEFKIVMEQDPKLPVFHNNTNVDYIEVGEPYGDPRQFFAELGTIVVEMKEALGESGIYGYPRSYDVLKPENLFFGGISIDRGYGGVHLREIPYKAVYLNPFYEWGADTLFGVRANIYETITHELAHTGDMEHGVGHNNEMIKVRQYLADQGLEDYFRDSILKVLAKHESVFTAMKEAYGRSTTQNVAKSLEEYNKDSAATSARRGKAGDKGAARAVQAGKRRGRDGAVPPPPAGGAPSTVSGRAGKSGQPVKKKAAEAKPKETPDQFKDRRVSQLNNKFNKNTLVHRIGKYFSGEDAGSRRVDLYERAVKFFQNEIRPLQQLEQGLRRAKKLIVGAPGFNNAFSIISSAQDKAAYYSSTILKQPMDAAYKAIETYAKLRNFDTNKALEELDRFRIIMHEPERRDVMYMLNVPLSTKRRKFISPGGKVQRISPAEIRQEILKRLITPADLVSNGQAKAMGDTLRKIVSDPANIDPLGDSPLAEPGKPVPTDKNDRVYNVLGGYSPEFIAELNADAEKIFDENPELVEAFKNAIESISAVQEATKELNRKAKYWSKPVDNIVAFYDFEFYAPLKGRPDKSEAAKLDPNDRRVSGEMAEAAQAMEGRQSEAENSILQSFSDAYYAAARAGREGATEAVKNLIEQGHIKGKLVGKITMADRYLNRDFSMKPFKGENKIFHHNDDGTIEVYQIAPQDLRILQAIRRPYQESNWATRAGNAVTGFIGQMHTRFNPSFAPLNFPRDVITNTLFIAGDYSAGDARRYFTDALVRNVMKGGLYKSGKISTLIEKGDINKVRELAKKDDFARDTLEWIERGGRTAYQQSYSIGAQAVALDESLGKKGVVAATKRGFEQVAAVMDIYNDAFEFTNRVAAYAMARNKAQAQLIKDFTDANNRKPNAKEMEQIEEAAKTEGASFAKNLANFRLVGDAGREAGALFMFFRPAATGAVRAIDTLLPALVSFETALSKQPESIQKDPEAVKNFRKDYEARKTRARWTMFVTAAAGAFLYELALAGADDDEQGRNKIATDDMARWTRYARMPVLGEDTMLQIPWGFGISAFGAFGAQMAALARGNVVAKDVMANTINIAFDSFIPIPKSNINVFDNFAGFLVDSVTPSALRPFVEYAMNTDSLGNQIYNNRQSRYSDVFTGGSNIPEFYKMLARNYFEMTGFEVSPNTVYFWTSNYVDALGRVATSTYDLRLFASGDREFRSVDDLDRVVPFIDSFIGTRSNYDARQYADVENQVKKKAQILNSLKFRPDEYTRHVEKNPADEEMVKFYERAIRTDLAKLREDANFIRNTSELSTQQKRDLLKENTRMQNLAKRNLIDSFKIYYGIEPK